MEKKLLDIVNTVLVNASLDPVDELNSEMRLRDTLGLDSINLAELTVRVEEAFGVDIFEDGVVQTVGEIEQKLKAVSEN